MKYLIYCLCLLFVFSCKRSLDKSIIGPEIQNSSNLVVPFQASSSSVNFRLPETNVVKFNGKFEKLTKWKITIKGLISGATKTLYGNSEDISLNSLWNGSQDSLYFFRDDEMVIASLSLNNSILNPTDVSRNLENRGDIIISENEIARDTILIVKGKASNPNQVELFPKYIKIGDCTPRLVSFYYNAGYDIEGTDKILDKDPSIKIDPVTNFVEVVADESQNLLTYSKYQGGIRGTKFFMLKGQDVSTKISTETGPDYYVGRLESVNLKDSSNSGNRLTFSKIDNKCGTPNPVIGKNIVKLMEQAGIPDNLYFNVFVYGNADGSKINYTIKEDDSKNGIYQGDRGDESYEKAIVVDFKGWKLFSFKYSEFSKATFRDPTDGIDKTKDNGNGKQNISNIISVQFGLVSGTLGGKAQMIIDVPTVSVGQPFSY
ncbi:MAG: hypothetical protein H7329_18055 [Opitutaceae bacterium]|nr:hypothetical protein [Cytophagales bacterium]